MASISPPPTLSELGAKDDDAPLGQTTAAVPPRPGFQDATALLFSACAQLQDGQMVAVSNFTLMDSMAAVKIMDARMDSGMELPASELPESDRLDETLALPVTNQFDPFQPLTVPDVLWIMDRLLACEAAWHQGSALSQTLYTCLYFHAIKSLSHKHPRFQRASASAGASSMPDSQTDPTPPPEAITKDQLPLELVYKVLRAFILATVKTIDIAWTELTSQQHLHDGEDYASDKNGISLLETTDTGYVIAQLEDALQWVKSQHESLPSNHIESLKTRLSFRKQMLYAVRLLATPAEAAPLDVVMHTRFARRSWTLLHYPSEAHSVPETTLQKGALLSNTNGKNPTTLIPLQQPNRNAAPSIASAVAFDPAYNRRLAWCQALKPISLPNALDTWRIMDGILEELQDVVRVLQHPGFLSWKAFFTHRAVQYQTSQPLSATPYVRSLFQTAVCDRNRNMIASRLPLEWITETFFQQVALVDPLLFRRASRIGRNNVEGGSQTMWNAPPPLGQRVYYFMQRVAGQLVQYLTALSQNRSRCKRTLASRLYREWVHISQEAQDLGRELEECLGPGECYLPDSLFAATQHLALEIMTQITLSGFELDLYVGATDRESMWWLASRIQVEQKIVCTDLHDELFKWLKQTLPEHKPRRHATTLMYLSRQISLAQATERLAISSIFLKRLSERSARVKEQSCLWPLDSEDESSRLELAGAVFASRVKWMRTDSPGNRAASKVEDPGETLWQEYLAFRSELNATDDATLTTLTKERLDEATKLLQKLADSLESEQSHELGVEGFSELVRSLLATARHNQEALRSVADRPAATPSAVDDFASSTENESKAQYRQTFEHPWFPKWSPPRLT
ncbi:uncharacterized protein SPSC_03939 [Sporisorium scitamineum]|uniref:Mak10-domain-containing protein n=1 Tax=Sporisorium scitamineum TaxID=49012 RepID=A0A0F7RWC6_9BASI|nr:uncharacterized protein SPSC_03939 [Sporisorium scitamineum]CDR99658.1 hypothetical protein [Sporisorium scitamineum]